MNEHPEVDVGHDGADPPHRAGDAVPADDRRRARSVGVDGAGAGPAAAGGGSGAGAAADAELRGDLRGDRRADLDDQPVGDPLRARGVVTDGSGVRYDVEFTIDDPRVIALLNRAVSGISLVDRPGEPAYRSQFGEPFITTAKGWRL